jgi:ppGpp synthetase/RelA/SpoT-type nucleotidyltranferase
MEIDQALLKTKMDEYAAQYDAYKDYAGFLKAVLASAVKRLAPGSFVEARPKSKASFAEKVVRKQWKFKSNPNYDITDRCAARVSSQNPQDKQLLCDYIRNMFDVDEENSLDKRSELKTDQFGYLSVHYVVQIKDTDAQMEGIPVPKLVKTGRDGFKAEIQVRTLLEHAWANALHDRLYKVSIRVPTALQRDAAGLAATIEATDMRLLRLTQSIDNYLGHYAAYLTRKQIEDEIKIFGAARRYETNPDNRAVLTLRLGRLLALAGRQAKAIAEWESAAKLSTTSQTTIRMELGQVLCRHNCKQPSSTLFKRGQRILEEIAGHVAQPKEIELPWDRALRAEAAHRLAWSFSLIPGQETEARAWYRVALERDPSNPYHLASFLEHEVFCNRTREFVEVMRTSVEQAIASCRAHIAVGIEIPRAHFTIGRLYLLLGDYLKALASYLNAVQVVLSPGSSCPTYIFDPELDFLNRINIGRTPPPQHGWVRRLLTLASALHRNNESRPKQLAPLSSDGAKSIRQTGSSNALIVVGGAGGMPADEVREYRGLVRLALEHTEGLVCSGGTAVGIPGLVGEIAAMLKKENRKKFTLVGYVPARFKRDIQPDEERYDNVFSTDADDFSELEPLQGWIDLLQAGITPDKVRVLGINGGPIAAFEYRLALALGARVGVVERSGREADALFQDSAWATNANLVRLPKDLLQQDPATVRAFVRPAGLDIEKKKLEELAALAHEQYLSQDKYSAVDPVRKKYGDLRPDLQESNRQQILYAAEILATEGYVVRRFKGPKEDIPLPAFKKDEVERMAQLEHGRWNIERLAAGWRHGPKKDVANKINPCLVSWKDLPDGESGVKKYDRVAINNYAALLKEAGYVVVKAAKGWGSCVF